MVSLLSTPTKGSNGSRQIQGILAGSTAHIQDRCSLVKGELLPYLSLVALCGWVRV
jgi:hypothetical protein